MTYRWTERDIARRLERTGTRGAANTADTSRPPFQSGDEVVIELPLVPSTNHLFINKLRGGRVKSPEYRAWIKEAGTRLALQHPPQIKGRVSILIEVSEGETPASADVANREKGACDLLVSMGVIEGDSKKFVREITMRWANISGMRMTIRRTE